MGNLTASHLIGTGTNKAETLTVYSFSGPRTGDPIFAAKYNREVLRAWRIFNTEDLVPTLPLSTVDANPKATLGLFETNIELILKLFLKRSPFLFQHVNEPVALTYQLNTVADNHNLTQLYSGCNLRTAPPTRFDFGVRTLGKPRFEIPLCLTAYCCLHFD